MARELYNIKKVAPKLSATQNIMNKFSLLIISVYQFRKLSYLKYS